MRVLVTGAAGFIGSHLVDHLLGEGDEVHGIDDMSSGQMANLVEARRSSVGKFRFHRLDITSTALTEFVNRTKPELVFHLAAQVDPARSLKDPIHDTMVNVVGTLNLLQVCSRAGVQKVIFTTTADAAYGRPSEDRLPLREEQALSLEHAPPTPHGVSKKVVLDYLRYFGDAAGLDHTTLVLSNVYGPRQEPVGQGVAEGQVVAVFCRKMLARRPCTIYGDGIQTRDFVYVADVVSALLAARDAGSGDLYNVSSGRETSINELFAQLSELTSSRYEPIYGAGRAGDLERLVLDPSRASEELGWTATTDLSEGLRHTVAWFKAAQ